MAKVSLTDKFIKSDARVPKTGRADYHDALVPGLALRVSSGGHRSFVLVARYPSNPKNPTRRAIGQYGAVTLDDARTIGRNWLALIQKGKDPKSEEATAKAREKKNQITTFAKIASEFLDRHAAGLAKAKDARHTIETEFVKPWGTRPAADIQPEEAADAIRSIVKRGSPYQAKNALGYLRRMYSWAIATHEFGLTASPVDRLKPAGLIGRLDSREHVLRDPELRAVWKACAWQFQPVEGKRVRAALKAEDMGYPYGPLIRLLILTGLRLREVAEMSWSEVDLDKKLWVIPAARMKGKAAHEVPLATDALALLKSLPHFKGDFVFTTSDGAKPVDGFSKAKARLDKLSGVKEWKIHDLRRTVRTHLSALPVQDLVRELILAHAQPGLHRIYDLHTYQAEKLECLTLWENRLRGILMPKPPAGVADLQNERARRAVT
jgi:integrase